MTSTSSKIQVLALEAQVAHEPTAEMTRECALLSLGLVGVFDVRDTRHDHHQPLLYVRPLHLC